MAFQPRYGVPFGAYPISQSVYFNPVLRAPGSNPVNHAAAAAAPSKEPTTVFVGNISEKCTDEFMYKILEECGKTSSWKRIRGSNGKLQGFGFCNFVEPIGTMRALRVLNEFQIGEKKLVVKAEDKVREDLRKWAINHRRRLGKKDMILKEDELPADEEDLKKDEEVRLKILNWIEADYPELINIAEDGELSDKESKKTKKTKEESKKDVEKAEKKDKEETKRRKSRSRSPERVRDKHRRSRSGSPKNKRRRRGGSSSSHSRSSGSSGSSSSSSRSRSRSPVRNKRRRDRSASRRSSEDSDDARERRLLRKQVKEKEQAYLSRLHKWETREKQKSKQYERDERREKEKKSKAMKEVKKLKSFLEDYDDEKDDAKYYKSSSLFQRKREFEREREADQKDRLREQQEIEELKKQIAAENQDKDEAKIEAEARKRHREQEEAAIRRLRADSGSPNPHQPLGHPDSSSSSESEEASDAEDDAANRGSSGRASADVAGTPKPANGVNNAGGWKAIDGSASATQLPATSSAKTASPAVATASPRVAPIAQRLNGVFGDDDDEVNPMYEKKKKLGVFQVTREERLQVLSADEKKELTKSIIRKIPTDKEELFKYPIEWDHLDKTLMNERIKPWVSKKVKEFLGEEEAQLVEFICRSINNRESPSKLLQDIALIIDEDADMFVVKLWRLLIFESNARRIGIS
ncbi:unnamed protein product [Caenorhabditis auriculariae]|uniref:RNA-binding protein 25 n=1 Tax=Caenorhabditis auriculariae TaxID=2777116 RepID=A0A8S1H8K8_9PELO|nr:unnamed protein product [Caenorhabditis auriculariae]